jgi:hypothetical protein
MSKLLLFSLLVFCTTAFAQAANSSVMPSPNESVATPANPFAGMPQGLNPFGDSQTNVSDQGRMCLRIHAFIFKTDDDRVPELVRETTCMPATGGAKKADFTVQPKLKPADGSNRF